MLKIGTLRWKGRCGRHPQFDPNDGEGAIRGGCARCYALLDIHRSHRRLLELMRAFGPPKERPARTKPSIDEHQPSLFDY
jgi:hypothetical protein